MSKLSIGWKKMKSKHLIGWKKCKSKLLIDSQSRIKTIDYVSYTQLVRMVKIIRYRRPEALANIFFIWILFFLFKMNLVFIHFLSTILFWQYINFQMGHLIYYFFGKCGTFYKSRSVGKRDVDDFTLGKKK